MKKLKCILYFLPMAFLAFSCVSTRVSMNEYPIRLKELARDEYEVLDNVRGEASASQFWLLCFPFGGASEKTIRNVAYADAISAAKSRNADGLLQPNYESKRMFFTLLLFSYIRSEVTVEGKAFRIKNDSELKGK